MIIDDKNLVYFYFYLAILATKLNQKIWKNSYKFICLCYSSKKNFKLIKWVVVEIKIPEIFNVEKTSQERRSRWNFSYSNNIITSSNEGLWIFSDFCENGVVSTLDSTRVSTLFTLDSRVIVLFGQKIWKNSQTFIK
jgi:hypothetical protein